MPQRGKRLDRDTIARWTLINIGFTAGDGFSIGPAARVAALHALRLRQPRVNLIYGDAWLCLLGHSRTVWPRFTVEATTVTVCW